MGLCLGHQAQSGTCSLGVKEGLIQCAGLGLDPVHVGPGPQLELELGRSDMALAGLVVGLEQQAFSDLYGATGKAAGPI